MINKKFSKWLHRLPVLLLALILAVIPITMAAPASAVSSEWDGQFPVGVLWEADLSDELQDISVTVPINFSLHGYGEFRAITIDAGKMYYVSDGGTRLAYDSSDGWQAFGGLDRYIVVTYVAPDLVGQLFPLLSELGELVCYQPGTSFFFADVISRYTVGMDINFVSNGETFSYLVMDLNSGVYDVTYSNSSGVDLIVGQYVGHYVPYTRYEMRNFDSRYRVITLSDRHVPVYLDPCLFLQSIVYDVSPVEVMDVFDRVGSWLSGVVQNISTMFWTAESGMTVLGYLAVASLALAVILLIFYLIAGWLKFH